MFQKRYYITVIENNPKVIAIKVCSHMLVKTVIWMFRSVCTHIKRLPLCFAFIGGLNRTWHSIICCKCIKRVCILLKYNDNNKNLVCFTEFKHGPQ